jgi:hypothetical protein
MAATLMGGPSAWYKNAKDFGAHLAHKDEPIL